LTTIDPPPAAASSGSAQRERIEELEAENARLQQELTDALATVVVLEVQLGQALNELAAARPVLDALTTLANHLRPPTS
jgi:hypothetical protein